MTDFREEAYILEKISITEDEENDEYEYGSIHDSEEDKQDSEDDLNNFEALKVKTNIKMASRTGGQDSMKVFKPEPKPKVVERDVVIDDFIRNFLSAFNMDKTLNIFQTEWHELQKKGTFHDTNIGLITDIGNKNDRLREKIEKMKGELSQAKVVAEQAKSTWEKLRKERDFHKTH